MQMHIYIYMVTTPHQIHLPKPTACAWLGTSYCGLLCGAARCSWSWPQRRRVTRTKRVGFRVLGSKGLRVLGFRVLRSWCLKS